MAVQLITTIQVFQGRDDDDKPDDTPIGSTYRETNGERREWTMETHGWTLDDPGPINVSVYEAQALNNQKEMIRLLGRIAADA